jgi:hypothetical protein
MAMGLQKQSKIAKPTDLDVHLAFSGGTFSAKHQLGEYSTVRYDFEKENRWFTWRPCVIDFVENRRAKAKAKAQSALSCFFPVPDVKAKLEGRVVAVYIAGAQSFGHDGEYIHFES